MPDLTVEQKEAMERARAEAWENCFDRSKGSAPFDKGFEAGYLAAQKDAEATIARLVERLAVALASPTGDDE